MTVILQQDLTFNFTVAGLNDTTIIAPAAFIGTFTTSEIGSTLINHGLVQAGGTGVTYNNGSSGEIINEAGAVFYGGANGVQIHGDVDVVNRGLILSDLRGIVFDQFCPNFTLLNTGRIYGGDGSAVTILTTTPTAGPYRVENRGEIRSDNQGILINTDAAIVPVIVNHGTIDAAGSAIVTLSSSINLTNHGRMVGDVTAITVGAADKVVNNGTIVGIVSLASGNDTYRGTGQVTGTVFGEPGNDSLSGGNFADRLNGGIGNDTLNGGKAADQLRGAENNDAFVFTSVTHSRPGAMDRILDFDDPMMGNDTINLAALFGPRLDYIGRAAFSDTGQVRVKAAGADVIVEVNTTGSLAADFAVRLVATTIGSITASDFIL